MGGTLRPPTVLEMTPLMRSFMHRMIKKVKERIAVNGFPLSQLRDVTCHMGSHSVTCHPTQVNAPRLNPSQ